MRDLGLDKMMHKRVEVLTNDQLVYAGKLIGVDQQLNLVLDTCSVENVATGSVVPKETVVLRGDLVCCVSLTDK